MISRLSLHCFSRLSLVSFQLTSLFTHFCLWNGLVSLAHSVISLTSLFSVTSLMSPNFLSLFASTLLNLTLTLLFPLL